MFYHPDLNYFKCDCYSHIILKKAQQNTSRRVNARRVYMSAETTKYTATVQNIHGQMCLKCPEQY